VVVGRVCLGRRLRVGPVVVVRAVGVDADVLIAVGVETGAAGPEVLL
jgi:hypothetical protein